MQASSFAQHLAERPLLMVQLLEQRPILLDERVEARTNGLVAASSTESTSR
jgi:hypothetical protein